MSTYTLHFDGSYGPKNPGGTAACGFVLSDENGEIERGHRVVGEGEGMSNNLAEFAGLAGGLDVFLKHAYKLSGRGYLSVIDKLTVRGDSQLVINVMSGRWPAHSNRLYYPQYLAATTLLDVIKAVMPFLSVEWRWVPREQNTICDELSKAHLA